MFNNIYSAPSPNVGECDQKGTWSSKDEQDYCKACFNDAGENANDYFYCEGSGCLSKYSSQTCGTGSLVAKNIDQCSAPCFQQGYPTLGGGCSDKYDCNYKNGEICQKRQISINGGKEERGYCVQGPTDNKGGNDDNKGGNDDNKGNNNKSDNDNANKISNIINSVFGVAFILFIIWLLTR